MQEHKKKPTQKEMETEATELAEVDAERQAEIREKAEKQISDIDALLDEIDKVLEENASEFVEAYKQKGGQ